MPLLLPIVDWIEGWGKGIQGIIVSQWARWEGFRRRLGFLVGIFRDSVPCEVGIIDADTMNLSTAWLLVK